MSKQVSTKYVCDSCSETVEGSQGLPEGWFAVTRQAGNGKKSQKHWHFCSAACLRDAAMRFSMLLW